MIHIAVPNTETSRQKSHTTTRTAHSLIHEDRYIKGMLITQNIIRLSA